MANPAGVGAPQDTLSNTEVLSGQTLVISSGVISSGLTVDNGGQVWVLAGGEVQSSQIDSGGDLTISSGGLADSVEVVSGGVVSLQIDAQASNVTVSSGGTVQLADVIVGAGQTLAEGVQGAQIELEGVTVQDGGIAAIDSAVVPSGGSLTLQQGAVISQVMVSAGGELLGSGLIEGWNRFDSQGGYVAGVVSGMTVGQPAGPTNLNDSTFGILELLSGGRAYDVTLQNGVLNVDSGGQTFDTMVMANSDEVISAGAENTDATVLDAGTETISGMATDLTVDSGGVLQLAPQGSVTGLVVQAGATLELAGVFGTSVQINTSGQLVIADDGSVVETLDLGAVPDGARFILTSPANLGQAGAGAEIVVASAIEGNLLGDGQTDLLIEDTQGAVVAGEVGEGGQLNYTQLTALGPEWSFVGVGDFLNNITPSPQTNLDQDLTSNILLEDTDGAVVVGQQVNGQEIYAQVGALGPEWRFEGVGDFLAHAQSDFLIENTAGALVVGEVVDGAATYTTIGALGPEWSFQGTGDFLGDGKAGFLIENTAGAVVVGEIINGQASYTAVTALGPEWSFQASGDFLGDGQTDFLIENTSGTLVVGQVGPNHAVDYTMIGGLGPEWKFAGAGDYLGTGVASFLIENTGTGAVYMGTVVAGQAQYAQVGGLGSEWSVKG